MWLFGASSAQHDPSSDIKPEQIKQLIETWERGSCQRDFLRRVCYAGIPLCYRGAIWNLLCGNSLQITSDLYKIFKHRAMKLSSVSKSRYADGPPQESFVNNTKFEEECRCIDEDLEAGPMQGKEESMTIIRYDIPRTFAEIHDFHNGSPLAINLELILHAYACYRPDIGYVQGMSYIAAMVVYYMDEFSAFKCLANILARRMSFDFYQLDNSLIDEYTETFNFFFELRLPLLCEHFSSIGLSSRIFLMDWAMTAFSKAFSIEIAARLWDVYLLEGEIFLIRAAIGILKLHQELLMSMDEGSIIKFLKRLPTGSTCPNALMQSVQSISISQDAYDAIMIRSKKSPKDKMVHRNLSSSNDDSEEAACNTNSLVNILCPPFGTN